MLIILIYELCCGKIYRIKDLDWIGLDWDSWMFTLGALNVAGIFEMCSRESTQHNCSVHTKWQQLE